MDNPPDHCTVCADLPAACRPEGCALADETARVRDAQGEVCTADTSRYGLGDPLPILDVYTFACALCSGRFIGAPLGGMYCRPCFIRVLLRERFGSNHRHTERT